MNIKELIILMCFFLISNKAVSSTDDPTCQEVEQVKTLCENSLNDYSSRISELNSWREEIIADYAFLAESLPDRSEEIMRLSEESEKSHNNSVSESREFLRDNYNMVLFLMDHFKKCSNGNQCLKECSSQGRSTEESSDTATLLGESAVVATQINETVQSVTVLTTNCPPKTNSQILHLDLLQNCVKSIKLIIEPN